jgi:hypothetical protein
VPGLLDPSIGLVAAGLGVVLVVLGHNLSLNVTDETRPYRAQRPASGNWPDWTYRQEIGIDLRVLSRCTPVAGKPSAGC